MHVWNAPAAQDGVPACRVQVRIAARGGGANLHRRGARGRDGGCTQVRVAAISNTRAPLVRVLRPSAWHCGSVRPPAERRADQRRIASRAGRVVNERCRARRRCGRRAGRRVVAGTGRLPTGETARGSRVVASGGSLETRCGSGLASRRCPRVRNSTAGARDAADRVVLDDMRLQPHSVIPRFITVTSPTDIARLAGLVQKHGCAFVCVGILAWRPASSPTPRRRCSRCSACGRRVPTVLAGDLHGVPGESRRRDAVVESHTELVGCST